MNDVLRQIVEATRAALRERSSNAEGTRAAAVAARASRERNRFSAALRSGPAPRLIAEIKAASPSAGAIAPSPDVDSIARAYRQGGASAISVVTEPRFFHGSIEWVARAAAASALPVVMKDFIVDAVQIDEAAAAGADAVLLIAAILSPAELRRFIGAAQQLGLDALVEVHDELELAASIDAGAAIIGVNNRNLHDFTVDLATAERLAGMIPPGAIRVAESGIRGRDDIERLRRAGFDNFLVGEWLLRQPDQTRAVRDLLGKRPPRVKICGITRAQDAAAAAESGARFVGLVFAPDSPRQVDAEQARRIRDGLPATVAAVGVFRNQPVDHIRRIVDQVHLDYVQLHGEETPAEVAQMPVPVIKALPVHASLPDPAPFVAADWLLFDAASPGAGRQFDWRLLQSLRRDKPFFLAGGLNPENVAAAVREVEPDAIDISSGVEISPGVKSPEKIRSLFEAIRGSR